MALFTYIPVRSLLACCPPHASHEGKACSIRESIMSSITMKNIGMQKACRLRHNAQPREVLLVAFVGTLCLSWECLRARTPASSVTNVQALIDARVRLAGGARNPLLGRDTNSSVDWSAHRVEPIRNSKSIKIKTTQIRALIMGDVLCTFITCVGAFCVHVVATKGEYQVTENYGHFSFATSMNSPLFKGAVATCISMIE